MIRSAGRLPIALACSFLLVFLFALMAIGQTVAAADWPTHRGNSQRTGNVDGQSGPSSPKVLWVYRSTDHFVASPVAAGSSVYVSGLAAFNTTNFFALSTDASAKQRVTWSKSAPYLKLPIVSPPAIAGGVLVFGDGMHQTDGAVLHGLRADTGGVLWQLPVPGQLVHLEGSPTIAQGRVFIGGGNAGVLCIDPSRLTLEGKDVDAVAAQAALDKRWKELLAKYEVEKKADPDFAIAPSEDSLPKPLPRKIWQQGAGKWHVDASVAVVGERVLVASAYLDHERIGDRALLCLNSGDGSVKWQAPLQMNPWAGPTIDGDVVIVGCSSIRFEPKDIPKGKGEVVALSLADGAVRWRSSVPGGVISPVAVANNLAVFTATDGKIRARDASSGQAKWTYDAKSAFFAGPAIAGGTVYAVDLQSVVHAINLADGKKLWTLSMASEPAVKTSGMIYGGPIVHGGRLYLATCNLDGDGSSKPTVVVCIGE
jgi:outer membrane protein assembly factor BamB